MNKQNLLAVVFSVPFYCLAQTYPLTDFRLTAAPKVVSPEWYQLNNSQHVFSVSVAGDQLLLSDNAAKTVNEYAVPGGKLTGVNYGEFGGGLYYRPADTTKKFISINGKSIPRVTSVYATGIYVTETNPIHDKAKGAFLIASGNVKFIFSYKNALYFMTGLAHMSLSFGSLFRLDIQKDSFTVSKVLDFDDAPMAMTVFHDTIYIATNERFYLLDNLNQQLIFKELFWDGLYPNSIAVADDKHIYVGIRGGYVSIDLPERELKFYKYTR